MAQISLTRALTEVKTLEARIAQSTNEAAFVGVVVGKDKVPHDRKFKTVEELETAIKASVQKLDALVARRSAVKKAITIANVSTNVVVNGKTITIAEAIDLKNTLQARTNVINKMMRDLQMAVNQVNALDNDMNVKVQAQANALFGKDNVPKDQFDQLHKNFADKYGPALSDPLGIVARIEKERAAYDEIVTQLDYVLSETNARTLIEIPD
jgi:seryl-tRNA synthetase